MNAGEFKKENHFRYTADRTCFNCKYCGDVVHEEYGPEGRKVIHTFKCFFDKDNPKHSFQVYNVSVCDRWERNGDNHA